MRTKKSIINLITGVISVLIISLGKFIVTKVFIEKLGTDLNGLNQIFTQIAAYLSLAEGGMGTALVFALYQPLAIDNKDKVRSVLFAAKKIYRYIGMGIFIFSIVVAPYLNKFINTDLSKKHLAILFVLYVLRIVVDYFTNISRFLLQADQKEYKINLITTFIRMIDLIVQFLLLVKGVNLEIIFIKDILVILLINILVEIKVKAEYTWLIPTKENLDYSFLKNIRYLVIHSLCSAIVYNTDYIVLGKFRNLNDVTIYSSYLMIINFALSIPLKGINSLGASLGNLISENNLKSIKQVYLELFNITFYIASILSIGLYFLISDFITLWLGGKFVLDKFSVMMLIFIFIHSLTRQAAGILVNSKGLFKETRNSVIIEMILNLVVSIILVKNYGIKGVILGTLVAHLFSNFWYYPFICYREILKENYRNYWVMYIQNAFELLILFFIIHFMMFKYFNNNLNITNFMIKAIAIGLVTVLIQTLYYYLRWRSFREFLMRIYKIILKR